MSKEYENLKGLHDTRFTPVTDEVVELMWLVRAEYGGTWQSLSAAVGIRPRHLRRIHNKESKAVSLKILDRILARSDYSYKLHSLPWLTVDDLMEQGIWSIPLPMVRLPSDESFDDSEFSLELDADD